MTVDVIGAFECSLDSSIGEYGGPVPEGTSFAHLLDMLARMKADEMSYGKQCRWLGWAQGVLAARGYLTLEQCKQINKRFSLPPPPVTP